MRSLLNLFVFFKQNSDGKSSDEITDNIRDVEFELECSNIEDEDCPEEDYDSDSQHCQLYFISYT